MSTPDLSSPAAVAAFLRQYNNWRRDESELDAPDRPKMPAPADLGRVIDAAVRMLEGIAHVLIPTQPGDCEAAAFRTEDLRARVAELEASLSRADKRAMNAIADAEKRAYWFASMELRGEELKFSPDDVVRLDKLIMGLMLKEPPLHDLIDTAVVVLCKAWKRPQVAEPRIAELEARIAELEAEQVKQFQTFDGRGEIGAVPGYVTEACADCAGAGHARQQEAEEEQHLTLVFQLPLTYMQRAVLESAEWAAASWSHAIRDRDAALKKAGREPGRSAEIKSYEARALKVATARAFEYSGVKIVLRDCHSSRIKNHDPDPCSYRMRVTDPGCTGCVDRDEDQSAEAGG